MQTYGAKLSHLVKVLIAVPCAAQRRMGGRHDARRCSSFGHRVRRGRCLDICTFPASATSFAVSRRRSSTTPEHTHTHHYTHTHRYVWQHGRPYVWNGHSYVYSYGGYQPGYGYGYGYNPGAAAAGGVIGGILGAGVAAGYPYGCDPYGYGSCPGYGDWANFTGPITAASAMAMDRASYGGGFYGRGFSGHRFGYDHDFHGGGGGFGVGHFAGGITSATPGVSAAVTSVASAAETSATWAASAAATWAVLAAARIFR